MAILTLIAHARQAGLHLCVGKDGSLVVEGTSSDPQLLRALGERRIEVLAVLIRGRPKLPAPSPESPDPGDLASWPLRWREAWGRLANAVEDECVARNKPKDRAA